MIYLLLLAAAYASWRSYALYQKQRYGFAVALGFAALFCIYEFVMQAREHGLWPGGMS